MKVSDMVVRAYAFPTVTLGIIVEEQIEIIPLYDEMDAYEQRNFIIQWSDGTQSREMYEELDELEYFLESVETASKIWRFSIPIDESRSDFSSLQ